MKYDKEEQKIINAYKSGAVKLSKPSAKELEAIKRAAKNKRVRKKED